MIAGRSSCGSEVVSTFLKVEPDTKAPHVKCDRSIMNLNISDRVFHQN
jgi:hypothetical protein